MLERHNTKQDQSKGSKKAPKRRTDGFRVGILEDWRAADVKKGGTSNRGKSVRDGR
jgi:hypothetical protein